jgi:hypothetical protein
MIKSKKMRWVGHVTCIRFDKCKILVGNPEQKKPPGRHKLRWEDNIKMDSKEIGC